jgi:hypothetical protein
MAIFSRCTPRRAAIGASVALDVTLTTTPDPSLVHVRGVERLSVLVRLVGDESMERRPGRDLVLTRLVEVLLIEALRSAQTDDAPPGLLRGLADARRRRGCGTCRLWLGEFVQHRVQPAPGPAAEPLCPRLCG